MQLLCLVLLVGRNILDDRCATLWLPAVLLHQQHVDDGIKARTGSNRILYRHALGTINLLEVIKYDIVVAVLTVKLVDEEDNGLLQLLSITEGIHCTNLRTILSVDEQNSLVSDVECSDGTSYEVV